MVSAADWAHQLPLNRALMAVLGPLAVQALAQQPSASSQAAAAAGGSSAACHLQQLITPALAAHRQKLCTAEAVSAKATSDAASEVHAAQAALDAAAAALTREQAAHAVAQAALAAVQAAHAASAAATAACHERTGSDPKPPTENKELEPDINREAELQMEKRALGAARAKKCRDKKKALKEQGVIQCVEESRREGARNDVSSAFVDKLVATLEKGGPRLEAAPKKYFDKFTSDPASAD
jgi:hypothetical protein